MNVPDKVTTTGLRGGHPYGNLKEVDLRRSDTSQTTTINSVVTTTISGRAVYRPKPKSK